MTTIDTRRAPTAYIVLMALWVYGFANADAELPAVLVFVLLLGAGAVQVAAGYVLGRWWALSLGVVPVLLGLAASGTGSSLWLTLVLLMTFPGAPLIALGVVLRRWVAEREDASPDGWLFGERPE
ncbi:MAG: hypothetical protein M3304_07815 [Actinomycetota bacterium]|nr:hypothetical protein [Actinomycetota bacterium]